MEPGAELGPDPDPPVPGKTGRTLISKCHRAGADAQAYLTDLFTRLPLPQETTKNLSGLTPHGWAASHRPAAPQSAAA